MLHTALLAAMLVVGPVDGACSEPPRPALAVIAAHGTVAEDASAPLAAIREAARQRGGIPAPRSLTSTSAASPTTLPFARQRAPARAGAGVAASPPS